MSIRLTILFSFIFMFTVSADSYSQDGWWKEKKFKSEKAQKKYDLCKKTFKEISNGFSYGSISLISKYFNGEIFLDVLGNEKGYYSTGQAEYIISDFLDYYKVTKVRLINSFYKNSYAFVMGKYTYDIGSGKRELKLSVSLKYQNDTWYIDQINLN